MARHTLWCDHYAVDLPQFTEVFCAMCDEAWPCPTRQEYNAEMTRRFEQKRKYPVRLVHGAHSTDGPRGWKD